eukprot:CAMPEP_0170407884 /NCGR_PEP_ID=MMETSP0117_2-20130122/28491_1 /TAXON_ID=400756 /ORGANISM="Durinskia baltica, Strain CSIRO CS-38" /LENGTH=105 /DNA_ID=CAMNT_0010665173 /DNA_START=63 /DNA_END=378 /DNA_ORIENTATION=-
MTGAIGAAMASVAAAAMGGPAGYTGAIDGDHQAVRPPAEEEYARSTMDLSGLSGKRDIVLALGPKAELTVCLRDLLAVGVGHRVAHPHALRGDGMTRPPTRGSVK